MGDRERQSAVLVETLDQTAFSAVSAQRLVAIRDAASWTSLWAEHNSNRQPAPAVPAVDFNTKMVVAVFLGSRPNGCYSVAITRVLQGNSNTTVKYREGTPRPADVCTQVLTNPAHLAAVPLASGTVQFVCR